MGIEPTAQAWEAWVLPLYDARYVADSSRLPSAEQSSQLTSEIFTDVAAVAAFSRDQSSLALRSASSPTASRCVR